MDSTPDILPGSESLEMTKAGSELGFLRHKNTGNAPFLTE